MPTIGNQRKMNQNIFWLGIIRTLLVQMLVLLALAGAYIWYVEWSSEAALKEFISAETPSLSGPNHAPQSTAPMQTVKGKAACARKG